MTKADMDEGFQFAEEKLVLTKLILGENPSVSTVASARSLAKLGAFMAGKGKCGEQEFISEETWEKMHSEPTLSVDDIGHSQFTKGGFHLFDEKLGDCLDIPIMKNMTKAMQKGREGYYGWMGFGGSVFQWHPELGISFAYTGAEII